MAFLVMSLDKTGRTLELVDTCLKNVARFKMSLQSTRILCQPETLRY